MDRCNWKAAKDHERVDEGAPESQGELCDESNDPIHAYVRYIRITDYDKPYLGIVDGVVSQSATQAIIREQHSNGHDDSIQFASFFA